MEFKEFLKEIENNIKNYLPERYQDASVSIETVKKNNDIMLNGLLIKNSNEQVVPTIYLENFYNNYKTGMSMENICQEIADVRMSNERAIDPSNILNPDIAKDNIVFRLVGVENNQEMLKDIPHRIVNDMAMTYHLVVSMDEGMATTRINNGIMSTLQMDESKLYEIAMVNTPALMPEKFQSMQEIMSEMLDIPVEVMNEVVEIPMYVLTNEQKINGAGALYYPGTMEAIAKELKSDLYVLPSSVHETIILPKDGSTNAQTLKAMVNEVNITEVAPEEVLTGNVYEYDARAKALTVADDPLYKVNKADIKQSGFSLSRSLEKNMESLNKATGKNNALKDVKEILNSDKAAEHIKGIAEDIAKECKQQELLRTAPEV